MRITVFGATRGTGRRFVRLALERGHEVEAVARKPEAVTDRHPNLTVRRGDVLAPETVDVKGADAVVYLVGPSGRGPTNLYSEGGGNVMDAMARQGVRRIVVVTNALDDQPADSAPQRLLKRLVRRFFLEAVCRDTRLLEREISTRDLDWTVVRPPRLTNGRATGAYRTAVGDGVRGGVRLSREDLAGYLLKALEDPGTVRSTIGIAY
ncbi:NAD(P)-dependent oxidoreductase [Microbispora sp. CA-102843]|uniref:NAD(P)-dependent oxidoreductase n=1 Tax=Microbispora sp. CA-102843 TaxID=3239952 RepID=UPI003D91A0EC